VRLRRSVRLVEEEPAFTPYGEAYEINCARYGREADMPIVHFKKRCSVPATGALITDPAQASAPAAAPAT
jgi:transformation/transcription domain-associated protein